MAHRPLNICQYLQSVMSIFALQLLLRRGYTLRRRRGRVVEGTPLLRVQARKGLEGSNPFVSATYFFEVAEYLASFAVLRPWGSDRGSIVSSCGIGLFPRIEIGAYAGAGKSGLGSPL